MTDPSMYKTGRNGTTNAKEDDHAVRTIATAARSDESSRSADDSDHTLRTVSLGTILRLLRYPFVILSLSIIPRMMGDVVYGQYALFMSIYLIFDQLTDIGFTQVLGRFIPEYEATGQRERSIYLLHGALYYGMILTLLIAGGIIVIPLVHPFEAVPQIWFVFMVILLLLTKAEGTFFAFLYGLNHIARYSSKEVMRSGFTFTFVCLGFLQWGLIGAFVGLAINEAIMTVVSLIWTRSYLFKRAEKVRFRTYRPFLFFGLKFYVPLFLFGTLQRSGNVFIQWLTSSTEQVAYFDIANQFLLMTSTFLGLILGTLLPSLSALFAKGSHARIDHYHRVVMTYCAIFAVLVYNALGWLGRDALVLVLGPEFGSVFPVAAVLTMGVFPGLIAYVGMNYAILRKEPGTFTWAILVGLAVLVEMCLLLTPRWGAQGTAWASVIAYCALALVFYIRYFRAFSGILSDFWKASLVGMIIVPFFRFNPPLLPAIAIFCVSSALYVAALMLIGILRVSDIKRLVTVLRGKGKTSDPT